MNPGVNVGLSATMGGGEPLKLMLATGTTYYAVIKGSASGQEGNYRIKLTDTLSKSANGERLACEMETGLPAVVEADFHANHTYYIVVERNAVSAPLIGQPETYAMTVHSLYRNRVELENAQNLNDTSSNAYVLPDPYRSKITVANANTTGMAANYTVQPDTATGTIPAMCGGQSSASPDAVYTFSPSINTNVKLSVNMAGNPPVAGQDAVIALYKGKPGSSASTTNLNVAGGNSNENTATAQVVSIGSGAQTVLGSTAAMTHDIESSLLSCGADPAGHDAVFKFSLARETEVEIDASASAAAGLADPVISLFHDVPLERPDAVPMAFDTYMAATTGPTTPPPAPGTWPPNAVGDWKVWSGDMALLTAANQVQVMMSNTSNINEVVNPATRQGAFQLGDIANTRVTVGGSNTSGMRADYGPFCGFPASADSPDAIYEFHTSQSGRVRISTERPAPGFNTLVKVWDGTRGAPGRAIDAGETLLDLNGPSVCGDGVLNFGEECDPLPRTPDDGCTDDCHFEATGWHCTGGAKLNDGFCDCGCGIADTDDCGGNEDFVDCNFPIGSCAVQAPTHYALVDTYNGDCVYPYGVWRCDAFWLDDSVCDCGCGAPDPACGGVVDRNVCDRWNLPGSCATAFADLQSFENSLCLNSGSANDNDEIIESVQVDLSAGGTRRYLGDSSGMQSDLPSADALAVCGAQDNAADAIFGFTLRRDTEVKIEASGPGRPVVALYDSGALGVPPAPVTLGNDEAVQADFNPSPSPQVSGSWVRYASDLSNYTISNQPQTTINNQDNINVDTPTRLISPINRRLTVTNASTRDDDRSGDRYDADPGQLRGGDVRRSERRA